MPGFGFLCDSDLISRKGDKEDKEKVTKKFAVVPLFVSVILFQFNLPKTLQLCGMWVQARIFQHCLRQSCNVHFGETSQFF